MNKLRSRLYSIEIEF